MMLGLLAMLVGLLVGYAWGETVGYRMRRRHDKEDLNG